MVQRSQNFHILIAKTLTVLEAGFQFMATDARTTDSQSQDALPNGDDGVYRSMIFSGLWLDSAAVVQGDLASVLKTLNDGLASASYQAFVASLASKSG